VDESGPSLSRRSYTLALGLSLAGSLLTGFLAFGPLSSGAQRESALSSFCSLTLGACDRVNASESSQVVLPFVGSIPTALCGLLFFSGLFVLLAALGLPRLADSTNHLAALFPSIVAVIVSIYLCVVMAIEASPCLLCYASHALVFGVFLSVVSIWPSEWRTPRRFPILPGHHRLAQVDRDFSQAARTQVICVCLVISVAVSELLVFKYAALERHARSTQDALQFYVTNPAVATALYRASPRIDVSTREAGARGRSDAPHTIVVFSDYDCPACKRFDEWLTDTILPMAPGDIRVVYKYRPLITGAGLAFDVDAPPPRVLPCLAAEAVRLRLGNDAFLGYHRQLMAQQGTLTLEVLRRLAVNAGVDAPTFANSLRTRAVVERVRSDVREVEAITKDVWTPVILLDNRLVRFWRVADFWKAMLQEDAGRPLPSAGTPTPDVAPPH
jgi:uncharacterized membrane protein